MFKYWQITLESDEQGDQPSLMPDEIKLDGNSIMAIMGRGTSRTIRLENAVKTLTADQLQIVRHNAEMAQWRPLQITAVGALY